MCLAGVAEKSSFIANRSELEGKNEEEEEEVEKCRCRARGCWDCLIYIPQITSENSETLCFFFLSLLSVVNWGYCGKKEICNDTLAQ